MVSGRSILRSITSLPLLFAGSAAALSSLKGSATDSKIAKNVLESKGEGYCSPSGPIENTLCAYETIEELNKRLYPELHGIVESNFFRYWKVDLFRECPFWYENGFCMNRDCGVETADESHIPEKWRTKALSQLKVSDDPNLPPGCDINSQSFCYIDSESPSSDAQYIDLVLNPERFTGYAGESAHRVWGAIYEENCFGLSEGVVGGLAPAEEGKAWAGSGKGAGLQGGFGNGVKNSLVAKKEEECLEKRIYYRIISGLHASISIHICADYLDQNTGEWAPNLQCFVNRIATNPERLANVYFDTVLLLRAIARAAPYLEAYDIETAQSKNDAVGIEADKKVREQLRAVLDMARDSGASAFDEKALFNGDDALELRDQFKHNFRNVSRILDCTGCDKCRLWGKLQISGIGTALKILFELDDKAFDPKRNPNLLQRSEIVALINTMHRLSESLYAVETFRKMYAETQRDEQARLAELEGVVAEEVKKPARPLKPLRRKGKTPAKRIRTKSSTSVADQIRRYISKLRLTCSRSLSRCLQQLGRGPLRVFVEAFGVHGDTALKKGVEAKEDL